MLLLVEGFRSFFLLSIGAILGSWTRMYLTAFFSSVFPAKYWATFVINILSSFFLGLFLASGYHSGLDSFNNYSPLFICVCLGFLGSMSTFSTFITELLDILLIKHWKEFFSLSILSLLCGFIAVFSGLVLGNA